MAGDVCDVCGHQGNTQVACSTLGAFSFAYCPRCLEANAEPKWMLELTIDVCGGSEQMADWFWRTTYYEDGQYQSATELRKTMK